MIAMPASQYQFIRATRSVTENMIDSMKKRKNNQSRYPSAARWARPVVYRYLTQSTIALPDTETHSTTI
jgi:hypothetical protein